MLTNDEFLGEQYSGTFDQFRKGLFDNAIIWHAELEFDCDFEQWFDQLLADHLTETTDETIPKL